MIGSREPVHFTAIQLGPLARGEVENALGLANHTQRSFSFAFRSGRTPLSPKYRLPNGGWNLDAAVSDLVRQESFPRPVVFLTARPFSESDGRGKSDSFYFADYAIAKDNSVAVISTALWTSLPGKRPFQPYILLSLVQLILSHVTDFPLHGETRGCPLDYCDDPSDIDRAFMAKKLCDECDRHLNRALRAGSIGIEQLASVKKLLGRALGRKSAFVVMPFDDEFDQVHNIVRSSLETNGWDVTRADEIVRPRKITDAIVESVLSSDLVVADITGGNPNVFYEIGLAHAAGRDVVLLTQERTIPFDVRVERAVIYRRTKRGLAILAKELRDLTR